MCGTHMGSAVDNDNDTGNVAGQILADRNGLMEVLSTLHVVEGQTVLFEMDAVVSARTSFS